MIDPIVEEVRKYRNEHAKKFNYDLDAICADLMQRQKSRGHSVINLHNESTHEKTLADTPQNNS